MKNRFELNKSLYDAVSVRNYEEAERLLKLGADPLGSADEAHPDESILSELFCEMQDDEALAAALPKLLELFYTYGMDIAEHRTLAEGDCCPLWDLAFCQTEVGLNVLHTMLEHGLDRDSAEILVDHILLDMEMCDGCEVEDDWWLEGTICGLKMVMLIASDPNLLYQSAHIQSCIELEKNDARKLPLFRNWNDFDYHIDISTCTNVPHGLQNATLAIQDRKTGEIVWTLSI